jgi:hypothetical protein
MDPAVDLTLRVALALLFATAAGHKLRDVRRFRAIVAEYEVLPSPLVVPGALAIVVAEVGVAMALVAPGLRTVGLVGAAALLAVYAVAVGVNLARGRRDLDCGCAGPAVQRPIGGWLLARNGVLVLAALAGLGPVRGRELVWLDAVTVVAATAALATLYVAVERLLAHGPALARLRGMA